MTSSVRLILGVSVLAASVGINAGCGSSSSPPAASAGAGPIFGAGAPGTAAGAPGTPGAGASGTAAGAPGTPGAGAGGGSAGGSDLPAGVPLSPAGGVSGPAGPGVGAWVDGMSNTLMIQGAMFPYADPTSLMGMAADFMTDGQACISGTAAKVDMLAPPCKTMMFTPPATDCYGEFWGAAVGLNLKQAAADPVTMVSGLPMPYDASALKGFAFDLQPAVTMGVVPAPKDLRFKVEDTAGVEYCTPTVKRIQLGPNTVLFSELLAKCYTISVAPPNPTAEAVDTATGKAPKSNLVKIGWQVITNITSTVPFNFCVSNIRALM